MKGLHPVLAMGLVLGGLLSGALTPASAQIYRWTTSGASSLLQGIQSVRRSSAVGR